jgi:hypothetical protein
MAMQKREKTMLMVLGGVVVAFVSYQVLSGGKSKPVTGIKSLVEKTAGQLGAESLTSRKPAAAFKYASEADSLQYNTWGKRNPFSKPQDVLIAEAAAAGAPVVVKGIIWMQGRPYVLINDVILTAGEEKKGIRVDRIEGRNVYCRKGGKSYNLQWSKSP